MTLSPAPTHGPDGDDMRAPATATVTAKASSPCIQICVVDGASGLCLGCLRSLKEIARWSGLCEAERVDIMSTLAARRTKVDPAKLALVR